MQLNLTTRVVYIALMAEDADPDVLGADIVLLVQALSAAWGERILAALGIGV